ncbi:hypothetical protein TD95_005303 [Thielaviopsis punctulata]|uniref:GDS1 winged helix domain-containing protein n=1 Tax=Thielaviopsis punctulata TaxID=72032 RepID=A0A0F4Z7K6_9PEZI|nr:hypothetical protein TD95_005303 [Thielaviopsis punctulata]
MPYNTRRKSLSLPSLGIHVPMTLAERAAANANSSANTASSHASKSLHRQALSSSSARLRRNAPSTVQDEPQSKRHKKSHGRSHAKADCTPPPSPGIEDPAVENSAESDDSMITSILDGVSDDVVRASIQQLHATENRPHLIKELAAVLSQKLPIMKQSTNPSAIVASRLSGFIKRTTWTPKSPCPIGKELENVHPRRTYFFLTTCPRQSLPELESNIADVTETRLRSFLSPDDSSDALSSEDEEEAEEEQVEELDNDSDDSVCRERSLSPEVDLSSPEFDSADDLEKQECSSSMPRTWLKYRRGRGPPPPLEKDEHEFTQTATGLQKRNFADSGLDCISESGSELAFIDDLPKYDLWANEQRPSMAATGTSLFSPSLKPATLPTPKKEKDLEHDPWANLGPSVASWDHISETIDLDELDSLLESC